MLDLGEVSKDLSVAELEMADVSIFGGRFVVKAAENTIESAGVISVDSIGVYWADKLVASELLIRLVAV